VPIETTFQQLSAQCQRQCDDLRELHIMVAEDRPLHGVVKLVDKVVESVEDALGNAEEALTAALEGQRAVAHTTDWDCARRALTGCHASVNRLQQRFFTELVCYEVIYEVVCLGGKRGGEWQAWVRLVRETLDRCRKQLFDTQQSLFHCWQEIAERMIPNAETPPAAPESKKLVLIKDRKPEKRNAS
jgi:hypothetical protein